MGIGLDGGNDANVSQRGDDSAQAADAAPLSAAGPSLQSSEPNLVLNASLEIAETTDRPAHWQPASWGDNTTAFGYAASGHSGAHSVTVQMTAHTSGDAKWVFEPVSVEPGRRYFYSDSYESNVDTKLVAAFSLSNEQKIYQALATVPASDGWAESMAQFLAPTDAVRASVFHLLDSTGSLQLDDVRLAQLSEVDPAQGGGVPNGSLEQPSPLNPSLPLAWRSDSFGSLSASFAYGDVGIGGSRGVSITVSTYESGDAKWYFDEQPVTPGTRYLFSDSYVGTIASTLTARFRLTDGTYRYAALVTVPPSSTFTAAQAAFLVPEGSTAVTVFHALAGVGTLTIDDAALAMLPPVGTVNGVPNGDLEQESFPGAHSPAGFLPNVWGTNDAAFSYAGDAHAGTRCARVDVTSYLNGTAAWRFDELPVVADQSYHFADYYRANVDTSVLARVTMNDGSSANLELGRALATDVWSEFSADLMVPKTGKTITVFHTLATVGYLQTDDYSVQPSQPNPFQRALVSVTFDDSYVSAHDVVLPVLARRGLVATHYVLTGRIDTSGRLSTAMLQALHSAGHELGAHTVNHYDLTTLSPEKRNAELADSKTFLEALGLGPALDFASPFGAYGGDSLADIRRTYASHRTTDAGFNTKGNFDRYRLKVQNLRTTTSAADVESWATAAAAQRSWLILVYHDVSDLPDSPYGVRPADFEAQIDALARHGLMFVTVRQALDELTPQL